MVYKVYRYSNKATAFSATTSLCSLILLFLGIGSIAKFENMVLRVLGAIVCLTLAVYFFVYLSRQKADEIAEKEFNTRIVSDAKYAFRFCRENPSYYESVAENNPAFAEQYYMNDENKIVKR